MINIGMSKQLFKASLCQCLYFRYFMRVPTSIHKEIFNWPSMQNGWRCTSTIHRGALAVKFPGPKYQVPTRTRTFFLMLNGTSNQNFFGICLFQHWARFYHVINLVPGYFNHTSRASFFIAVGARLALEGSVRDFVI